MATIPVPSVKGRYSPGVCLDDTVLLYGTPGKGISPVSDLSVTYGTLPEKTIFPASSRRVPTAVSVSASQVKSSPSANKTGSSLSVRYCLISMIFSAGKSSFACGADKTLPSPSVSAMKSTVSSYMVSDCQKFSTTLSNVPSSRTPPSGSEGSGAHLARPPGSPATHRTIAAATVKKPNLFIFFLLIRTETGVNKPPFRRLVPLQLTYPPSCGESG